MSVKKKSKAKKVSGIVLGLALIIIIYSIFSSRFTPSTNQARVLGANLSLVPMVSGYLTHVNVKLHSPVKRGDTLFVINQKPFKIALAQAEANLANATQNLTAGVSGIKAASAQLNRAKVQLQRATRNWERTKRIMQQSEGALSAIDRDRSEAAYLSAVESVSSAQANLDRQRAALGPENENNPMLKAAFAQLDKAQWDLEQTLILAPTDGIIESFNIASGSFASAGRPLASLVSNHNIWIQADFSENNLAHLKIDNDASITFDIDAGEVYQAKVSSIAYGVKTQNTNAGGLPVVRGQQGWLRQQQRFPVIITLNNPEVYNKLRQGSQANVVVYTGNNFLLNGLAAFKLWFISKVSYVR